MKGSVPFCNSDGVGQGCQQAAPALAQLGWAQSQLMCYSGSAQVGLVTSQTKFELDPVWLNSRSAWLVFFNPYVAYNYTCYYI